MSDSTQNAAPKAAYKVSLPDVKEALKSGIQFGHETRRWNPKMGKYLLGEKNGIHIFNVERSLENLEEAAQFLFEAASRGPVMFVATKKQASELVKNEAVNAGAYFVNKRWPGGLLTNFSEVKKSLYKLNDLEKEFEEGVEGRTKYEVSRMKKEWMRLDRLYSGIKTMTAMPTAVFILDTKYEQAAVRECRKINVPIIGVVDSNSDPDQVNYVIPGNDDAIKSIKLIMEVITKAAKEGHKTNAVKHNLKDFSKVEVKITRKDEDSEEKASEVAGGLTDNIPSVPSKPIVETRRKSIKSGSKKMGILERIQENKKTSTKETNSKEIASSQEKGTSNVEKTEKKEEKAPKKKAATKKPAKKGAKKTK